MSAGWGLIDRVFVGHVRKGPKNVGFVNGIDADYLQHGMERQGRCQSLSNDSYKYISCDRDPNLCTHRIKAPYFACRLLIYLAALYQSLRVLIIWG